jgi:pseudouridine-5'-phosphate glycosidase
MTVSASGLFRVSSDIAAAVAAGRPLVALETTLVTHGLPQPDGVRVAARSGSGSRGRNSSDSLRLPTP